METQIVDHEVNTEGKRPTFLTVLCILTFAASAYYLITGATGFFVNKSFDSGQWDVVMEQMNDALDEADAQSAEFIEALMGSVTDTIAKSIENAFWLALVTVIIALASAFGAYLMWQLKRIGFTVYVAAKIAGAIMPLFLLGVNFITITTTVLAAFIGLIFIVLYAVNRKYMTA